MNNNLDKELNTIVLGLAGQQLAASCFIEKSHLSPDVHDEFDALAKLLGTDKIFGLYPTKEGAKLNRPKICLDLATRKMGLATVGGIFPIKPNSVTVSTDGSQLNFEGAPNAEGEAEYYSLAVSAAIKPGQKGTISSRDLQNNPQDVLNPGGVTPPILVAGKLAGLESVVYKAGTPEEFTSYLVNVGGYQFGLNKAVASLWADFKVGADCHYERNAFHCGEYIVSLMGAPKAEELPKGEYPIKGMRQETVNGKDSTWIQSILTLEAGECRIRPSVARSVKQLMDGDNLKLVVSDGDYRLELTKDSEAIAARFAGKFKVAQADA